MVPCPISLLRKPLFQWLVWPPLRLWKKYVLFYLGTFIPLGWDWTGPVCTVPFLEDWNSILGVPTMAFVSIRTRFNQKENPGKNPLWFSAPISSMVGSEFELSLSGFGISSKWLNVSKLQHPHIQMGVMHLLESIAGCVDTEWRYVRHNLIHLVYVVYLQSQFFLKC